MSRANTVRGGPAKTNDSNLFHSAYNHNACHSVYILVFCKTPLFFGVFSHSIHKHTNTKRRLSHAIEACDSLHERSDVQVHTPLDALSQIGVALERKRLSIQKMDLASLEARLGRQNGSNLTTPISR